MDSFSGFGVITMLVIILARLVYSKILPSTIPDSVPWAGLRKEIFPKTRACIRGLTAGMSTLSTGYNQFNKRGLPCVVPEPGYRPIVMLPQEHIGWIGERTEDVLSARKTQQGRFALTYLLPGFDVSHDAFIMGALRKEVTRNLGRLQPVMVDDIRYGVDKHFGLDTESWKEVSIKQAVEGILFKSFSRVIVGSLCDNDDYIRHAIAFANGLGFAAVLVGQYVPWIMQPIFGLIAALPIRYHRRKALKFILPAIRDRVANIRHKKRNPSFEFEEPKDLISWMTQAMLEHPETENKPPVFSGIRLLFLTLGAIHTTIITASNVFLDLKSSSPDTQFIEKLREEAAEVFKTANDWTDPASLAKLRLADSTIRESLRKSPVLSRVLSREVMPRDGLTLPSGHHLPKGTWIALDPLDLHRDGRFYSNPDEYDAFRFATTSDDALAGAPNIKALSEKASIYRKRQGLATTSDIFLGFGHGKHSCPARWLVAHQLKLMFAYFVLNYNIQYVAERPANFVFGDSIVPPPSAKMMIRRRKLS